MVRRISTARWLTLCVLAMAAAFVASTLYSRRVSTEIDSLASSIAKNSAPSIVYLATMTEDIRLISAEAMHVHAETIADSRTRIAGWARDMYDAHRAYEDTDEYPGEHELYIEEEKLRLAFISAVDDALAAAARDPLAYQTKAALVGSAADLLARSIRALTKLNADHAASEGYAITQARQRVSAVAGAARALTLLLSIAGIVLAYTANREHVRLVEESQRQAEQRAAELDMFAGRIAHDLRAPLTIIELKSSSSRRTDAVASLHEALDRISRQGRRMAEMIDTLLAFAQSGARPGTEICPNVADVVQEVAGDNRISVGETAINLVIEPIGPAAVACSPSILGVILSNLVRNAGKYMGNGTNGVRRITIRTREHRGRVRFEVEDTGPGLPPGAEKKVFEPFVRLTPTAVGGIGLGLATVKRLTEAHDGRVGVESAPGRGARFWFELPLAPHAPTPEPREPNRAPNATRAEPLSSVRAP